MKKTNQLFEIKRKHEIKKHINKLKHEYLNQFRDLKMKMFLAKKELTSKQKKATNYSEKLGKIKSEYLENLQILKQWFNEEKTKIIKENIVSVDEIQYNLFHAKNVISDKNIFSRLINYARLTKKQKALYLDLKKQVDNELSSKKKSFAKSNVFEADNFNFFYGENQALFDINIKIKRHKVTAFIGSSGCGKSTFLRCLNRMNDQINDTHSTGNIYFNDGTNIKSKKLSTLTLTTRVGMIFQRPTPFPMSIYENIAYGPKSHGIHDKQLLDQIVRESLESAALWDEVKYKLFSPATALSGGQQQRLCIARAIALKPEVLLMDESTSGLDPIATSKIENLINRLKRDYTIIIVSHSMAQVQRVADYTAFFYNGHLIEYGPTRDLFIRPENRKTRDYISGKIR